MEIINSLIDFFGLNPTNIVTFVDFIVWFFKVMLAFSIVSLTIKASFTTSYKIERWLR